jgi:hypothetical protein
MPKQSRRERAKQERALERARKPQRSKYAEKLAQGLAHKRKPSSDES